MKRTLPRHLLFALAAMSLFATGASAATRCSDDPESCVKSASKVGAKALFPKAKKCSTENPAPNVRWFIQKARQMQAEQMHEQRRQTGFLAKKRARKAARSSPAPAATPKGPKKASKART